MLKTFIVGENQRGLLIEDGRLITILQPGRHRLGHRTAGADRHLADHLRPRCDEHIIRQLRAL